MKLARRVLIPLILAAWASLYLPGPSTLEFHDVQDLVYDLNGPSVDITLADQPDDRLYHRVIGMELAAKLEWLVPGCSESSPHRLICFSNGLIIARATPLQRLAITAALTAYRTGVRTVEFWVEKSRKILRALSRVRP